MKIWYAIQNMNEWNHTGRAVLFSGWSPTLSPEWTETLIAAYLTDFEEEAKFAAFLLKQNGWSGAKVIQLEVTTHE